MEIDLLTLSPNLIVKPMFEDFDVEDGITFINTNTILGEWLDRNVRYSIEMKLTIRGVEESKRYSKTAFTNEIMETASLLLKKYMDWNDPAEYIEKVGFNLAHHALVHAPKHYYNRREFDMRMVIPDPKEAVLFKLTWL